MFLNTTKDRNPELIRVAAKLHQEGRIPANTYVLDVDSIYKNAKSLVEAAERHGAGLYQMTKQHGRNPIASLAAEKAGIKGAVCVDKDEAIALASYGVGIGHVGHIQQVPDHAISEILSYHPEVVTCFSVEKALRVGEEACKIGRVQNVLFRVRANEPDGDEFHFAQEGGIRLDELEQAAKTLQDAPGVRLIGVTSHPNFAFDAEIGEAVPTKNLNTLLTAADILRDSGVDVLQVNAPGVTSCRTLPEAIRHGVTHVEPGSSLIGNTPLNSVRNEVEIPAMCYVSEISHLVEEGAITIGYGFYPRGHLKAALVGSDPDTILDAMYPAVPYPAESIDYYGKIEIPLGQPVPKIGDTVIYAFRSQVFVSNSFVAPVVGLTNGNPVVAGLWNSYGYPVDPEGRPLPLKEGEKFIELAGLKSKTAKPEQRRLERAKTGI